MRMTLDEYAAQYGVQEQAASELETMQALAAAEERRASDLNRAEELKESISALLEHGAEPETVLYSAVQCIGYLSNDQQWAEDCRAELNKVYSGLEQESMIANNAAIAEARLREQTDRYNERLRRQWTKQLKDYRKIAEELTKALESLGDITAESVGLDDLTE